MSIALGEHANRTYDEVVLSVLEQRKRGERDAQYELHEINKDEHAIMGKMHPR